MEALAGRVEAVLAMHSHQFSVQAKQLDHLDTMVHEVHQFIEEHRPALAKALAFLSPGRSVRDYFGKGARHERDGN